jgi:hypothetical protein
VRTWIVIFPGGTIRYTVCQFVHRQQPVGARALGFQTTVAPRNTSRFCFPRAQFLAACSSLSPVLSFPEIFQSVVILFSRLRLLGVASVFELQSAYFLCDTSDRQSFSVSAVANWSLFCLFLRPVVLFFPRLLFSECTSTFFPARFRSLFVFVFGFILLFLCMCVRAHRVGFLASSYCCPSPCSFPFFNDCIRTKLGQNWHLLFLWSAFALFLVSCFLFDFQRLATINNLCFAYMSCCRERAGLQ